MHFAGFIQHEQIAAYYALADVMVFPTLGDPHGLVVEEAMIAGLPVICSAAAGDIAARLPSGEAGLIVAPDDRRALTTAMRELAVDRARRLAMGARAQELAGERDHARYAAEFESFVTNTLARGARNSPFAQLARAAGWTLVLAGRKNLAEKRFDASSRSAER